MEGPADPLIFLGWVALISASGVIAPGPVFATALARGLDDAKAGLKISAGHALVEIPLILAIFFGFMTILQDQYVLAIIGLVGGIFLLYMGVGMFRLNEEDIGSSDERHGSFAAGAVLSATNPYFLLWWATVGAALIALAASFGWWMIPLFAAVHLACDLAWLGFVSYSASRSRLLIRGKWLKGLYMACGGFLMIFALYFLHGSLLTFL
ncbi:MAG: LysE family transporter [Euryarchaeota archaeon]|nr:LysE family transporter [Euryarchaeota archaeon]